MEHVVITDDLGIFKIFEIGTELTKVQTVCQAIDTLRDWFMIDNEAHDAYDDEERQKYAEACREAIIEIRLGRMSIDGDFLSIAGFTFKVE